MFNAPLNDAFIAHQARILLQLSQAEDLLRAGDEQAVEALGRMRWLLVRLLREYQIFKHSRIFEPALRQGSAMQVAVARDMKTSCIVGMDRFTSYVRYWSGRSVRDHWAEYHPAAMKMIADIRSHLATEGVGVARLIG